MEAGTASLGSTLCTDLSFLSQTTGYAALSNGPQHIAGVASLGQGTPRTHYGNPKDGPCMSGESPTFLPPIRGSVCSPACSTTVSCPTDVPHGTTATPECVLNGDPPQACALVCDPSSPDGDASCPAGARCERVQLPRVGGLCFYPA